MPIFEYMCKKCNNQFEELVSSRDSRVACPNCASHTVEKQLSTFGVGAHDPCASGACGMPAPGPMCGQGACPSCIN